MRAAGFFATLICALLIGAVAAPPAGAAPGMLFGVQQDGGMDLDVRDQILNYQRAVGAQSIRFLLRFDKIAKCNPAGAGAPTAPGNPCYDWSVPDAVIAGAQRRGMSVLLSVYGVPAWKFNGAKNFVGESDAQYASFLSDYADFIQAAGARYSGRAGLPRVTHWTIWNEPNGAYFWNPRFIGDTPVLFRRYAQMVDVASRRLKAVDATFKVAAGPTAPMAPGMKPIVMLQGVLPLLNQMGSPIDAWAHNAYVGMQSPRMSRVRSPEVGLGNIRDVTRVMDRFRVTRGKSVWITEFAYETNPPDPGMGVSLEQQSQWLAEATYVAWANPRIGVFMWYALFDDTEASGFNSGLFQNIFACQWCAKPAALMFQHPLFVSSTNIRRGQTIALWGHGRVAPAQTKIYLWQGTKWEYFGNKSPYSDRSQYVTFRPTRDTWFVTCDTSCGPMVKVTVR